jgi:hypothetical protein
MERELSTKNGSDTEKGNGARESLQRGARDGTLGRGLGGRPISAGRVGVPAPENDFCVSWG